MSEHAAEAFVERVKTDEPFHARTPAVERTTSSTAWLPLGSRVAPL